jgi:hypothetical protein
MSGEVTHNSGKEKEEENTMHECSFSFFAYNMSEEMTKYKK